MSILRNSVDQLSETLDTIFRFTLFLTLSSMIVIITAQIIFRVFFTALSWTEELSRYLLVWASFTGTTVAFRKGAHIAVTFAIDQLPSLARQSIQTITAILMASFFAVTIYYSIYLFNIQVFQVSPAIGIKMRYVYLIIPVSFSVMCVHRLSQMFAIWDMKEK